jgi:hypothetical protein
MNTDGRLQRIILEGGFGFRKYGVREKEAPAGTDVEDCKQWLLKFARKRRLPEGRCLSSFYLKHVVEKAVGHYVTNGAFIQAAIELGFKYSIILGPNAFFHIELKLPEDEWKRVKPQGFSKWLFDQDQLTLARDAKTDPTWPRRAKQFIDFWRYLNRNRCSNDRAEDDLSEAWARWTGQMAPRPDRIDTNTVYDRECDFISYGDHYPIAPEGSTYLYALVEIEDEHNLVRVKYVGQTVAPSKRLSEHIKSPGSIDRVKWIGQMLQQNKYPQMAIFQTGVALSMADSLEKGAIYAFQSCETYWDDELDGFPPLDDALLNIDK